MQTRNNRGELIGEINTAYTGTGEVIVTNTTYDRGNPVFANPTISFLLRSFATEISTLTKKQASLFS